MHVESDSAYAIHYNLERVDQHQRSGTFLKCPSIEVINYILKVEIRNTIVKTAPNHIVNYGKVIEKRIWS